MVDFLFECVLEVIGWIIAEFALERFFRALQNVLPRKILYGTSWRKQARREIMTKRNAAKGMA